MYTSIKNKCIFVSQGSNEASFKQPVDLGNGLQMRLTSNLVKAKWLNITINSNDTYTMSFNSMDKELNLIEKSKHENVYCDMLKDIFTKTTGLQISI